MNLFWVCICVGPMMTDILLWAWELWWMRFRLSEATRSFCGLHFLFQEREYYAAIQKKDLTSSINLFLRTPSINVTNANLTWRSRLVVIPGSRYERHHVHVLKAQFLLRSNSTLFSRVYRGDTHRCHSIILSRSFICVWFSLLFFNKKETNIRIRFYEFAHYFYPAANTL